MYAPLASRQLKKHILDAPLASRQYNLDFAYSLVPSYGAYVTVTATQYELIQGANADSDAAHSSAKGLFNGIFNGVFQVCVCVCRTFFEHLRGRRVAYVIV